MGRLAERRRTGAGGAPRPDRRTAGHHDGPARTRLGPPRAERRLGDRRRHAPRAGAARTHPPPGSSSTRRLWPRSRPRWAVSTLAAVARRSIARRRRLVDRCRALQQEVRAGLEPASRPTTRRDRRRLARRGARAPCSGRCSSRSCRRTTSPFDPTRSPQLRSDRRALRDARGDRARARVGAPLALAGAHDGSPGRRYVELPDTLRELRPADRGDRDARLRAGPPARADARRLPRLREGLPPSRRPSSTPRRTRSPPNASTRSTGSAARATTGTTSRSTRDIGASIVLTVDRLDRYADADHTRRRQRAARPDGLRHRTRRARPARARARPGRLRAQAPRASTSATSTTTSGAP